MGRGRAKAKQTKVARELKYSSPAMDIAALQRELGGGSAAYNGRQAAVEDVEEYDDPYAAEYDDEDDEQPASRAR
jgi:hypothetical protein